MSINIIIIIAKIILLSLIIIPIIDLIDLSKLNRKVKLYIEKFVLIRSNNGWYTCR